MAERPIGPRKRRTRQHVIADLSVNHVERIILDEGHSVHRYASDYGYDIALTTFDGEGFAEPGLVLLQLKASENLAESGGFYSFDLDVRDYNLWRVEDMPVILVLYDATRRKAYWLHVQGYFQDDSSRQPRKGAKTIRVRVPRSQVLNRRAVKVSRNLKAEAMLPFPRRT